MKAFIVSTLVAGAILASTGVLRAEHSKDCKNIHGKVTAVTEQGITVNDKFYKVGKSTRVMKDDKAVKLDKISVGDMVCLDARGKDDIAENGEIASVVVLTLNDSKSVREKEYVREKEKISEPSDSSPERSREVIREKEKIREQK